MTNLRKFVLGLTAAFGIPWLLLVFIPVLRAQKIMPQAYDKERDGMEGFYPGNSIYRQGQLVYEREGCVQCHTQMIRPSFNGIMDGWKKGWGRDQSDTPREVVRPSTMRDYLGEPVAPLGVQRNGPDLANLGYRAKDRSALHVQLYAPRATDAWSNMPAYRHLYIVRPIQGAGAPNALVLPRKFAPRKGYEVIPTTEAEELVNYLLSLKKDAPLPGQVVAEAEAKK